MAIDEMFGNKKINLDFITKISELGFKIDIPSNWIEIKSKNEECFGEIKEDETNKDIIFNIKIQVFFINKKDNICEYISADRVASNMGCIESVDFNNGHCNGKLICGEYIDGTCNYIFIVNGNKGMYNLRVSVDKHLEPMYEDIIDHIIYSFDIIDKI